MNRWIIGLAAVTLLVGVVLYFNQKENPPLVYNWGFSDNTTGDTPQTQVSIIYNGQTHIIGTYTGTCSEQHADFLPGEKAKVICWYAGGGNEIGVFVDGGNMVVKVGDVDEGSAEAEGFRGNFKTVLSL